MFETTMGHDMEDTPILSEEEAQAFMLKVITHFRTEFMAFVEDIKRNGIAKSLYDSFTPEEAIALWENYSADNQELFSRLRTWAEKRVDYFDDHECLPLLEGENIFDFILEIGLIIIIVKNEAFLSDEDIDSNGDFLGCLVELLWKSGNPMLKSAGNYIYYNDFESITSENIYDFDSES